MNIKSKSIECDNVSITFPSISIEFVNETTGSRWIIKNNGRFTYRADTLSHALRYLCGKQLISAETREEIEKRIN